MKVLGNSTYVFFEKSGRLETEPATLEARSRHLRVFGTRTRAYGRQIRTYISVNTRYETKIFY